jgi:HAMP domain-containing protein
MSGNHAGHGGGDARGVALNLSALHELAGSDEGQQPYAFDEFEQRGARRMSRRKAVQQGLVASFATVGVAVLAAIAVLQLRPTDDSTSLARNAPQGMPALVYDTPFLPDTEPAMVDVGRLAVRDELADRIALLDMQLNEGRAYAAPEDQLQQLAATREQLEQSLRGISYAHALMTY